MRSVATGESIHALPEGPIIGLPCTGVRQSETNAERRIKGKKIMLLLLILMLTCSEVQDYCKSRIVVTSSDVSPVTTGVSPPAIFRPPGMTGDSDTETEQELEDVKPELSNHSMMTSGHTAGVTGVNSYPNMLRLIHPQVYRNYHPYLHIHNLHPYFSSLYSQK